MAAARDAALAECARTRSNSCSSSNTPTSGEEGEATVVVAAAAATAAAVAAAAAAPKHRDAAAAAAACFRDRVVGALAALWIVLWSVVQYWRALVFFARRGFVPHAPQLRALEPQARVHVFSLVLALRLWRRPHYRHGTFRDDAAANLRNVAVPGTGRCPLASLCCLCVFLSLFHALSRFLSATTLSFPPR